MLSADAIRKEKSLAYYIEYQIFANMFLTLRHNKIMRSAILLNLTLLIRLQYPLDLIKTKA